MWCFLMRFNGHGVSVESLDLMFPEVFNFDDSVILFSSYNRKMPATC